VRVELLGPVRVLGDDGTELDLGGARNRALIARLALAAERPVRAAALVADLWGDDVPQDATNALQSVVSRTRRRLPDGAIELTPSGYVLHTETDVSELERAVAERRFSDAVSLIRGEPCQDLDHLEFVTETADRISAMMREARTEDLAVRIAADPSAADLARLAELAHDHPLDDRVWTLHIQALADTGRGAEALDAYEQHRQHVADQLGADPSPELQDLHLSILRGERRRQAPATRLPVGLTTFVGREEAMAELGEALGTHRLVTIVGPGGAGKTRLAIEVAREAATSEVWLAELAAVTSSEGVAPALLSALDLVEVSVLDRQTTAVAAQDRLLAAAGSLTGLLVLDNCEHLVDDVARLTEQLLAAAPGLKVLATTREPLKLIGEAVYPLDSLSVPEPDVSPDEARAHSAVDLFVQRAQAVDHAFVLDGSTVAAVVQICRRLDGQPLAMELAAARLRTLTVQQVAARLGDRFRLLTGGSRTALPRHRTLRAVVEWSWDLLDEPERDLAERLSVLPGGVTTDAAEAIGGPGASDLLEALVDKSLLVPVRANEPRFRMLETLREFGTERLLERGVLADVRRDQVRYVTDLVERAMPEMHDHRQIAAFTRIDAERGNISAALRLAVDDGDRSSSLRIVRALAWYWSIRNEHGEAFTWASAGLALPGEADPAVEIAAQALAITGVILDGDLSRLDGHVDTILALWDEHHPDDPIVDLVMATVEFFGRLGDRELPEPTDLWTRASRTLMRLVLLDNAGRIGETVDMVDDAIADFRRLGDRWGLATTIAHRGLIASYEGRFDDAVAAWEESLPLLEELGADEDIEFTRSRILAVRISHAGESDYTELRDELEAGLAAARAEESLRLEVTYGAAIGTLESYLGHHARAIELLTEVLARAESGDGDFGGGQLSSVIRGRLSAAYAGLGDVARARAEMAKSFKVAMLTRDQPVIASIGVTAAEITAVEGDYEAAARLLGATERVRGSVDRMNRGAVELEVRLRQQLGSAFEAAYAAGRDLDQAEALAFLTRGHLESPDT